MADRCEILAHNPIKEHALDETNSLVKSIDRFMQTSGYQKGQRLVISLSGGPDSMVLAYILSSLGYPLIAGHINYGNREETKQEQLFVQEECDKMSIPVEILEMNVRRGKIARAKYETLTADMRFEFYHALTKKYDAVAIIYGHHRGDMYENVLTNSMIRGRSMLDLIVIEGMKIKNGVMIWRPMLDHYKTSIFQYAHDNNVPYLKDTTPNWSNRWKVRNIVRPALTDMGMKVENVVQSALYAEQMGKILSDRIINPLMKKCMNGANWFAVEQSDCPVEVELFSMLFTELVYSIGVSKLSAKNTTRLHNEVLSRTEHQCTELSLKRDINIYIYMGYLFVTKLEWKPRMEIVELPMKSCHDDSIRFDDLLSDNWIAYVECTSLPELVTRYSRKKHRGFVLLPKKHSVLLKQENDKTIRYYTIRIRI